MNAIAEARVRNYLISDLHYSPLQAGTIIFNMRALAKAGGHDLDEEFGFAGLGAGPEARVASGIMRVAQTSHSEWETPEYNIKKEINLWLLKTPLKSNLG
jgi:hypothetical protein